MELVEKIVLFTHLLGFAAVAGGLLSQLKAEKNRITAVMLYGARWQFVSGLLLYGLEHEHMRQSVGGVKLGVALLLLAFFEMTRKKQFTRKMYWLSVVAVALLVGLALFLTIEN